MDFRTTSFVAALIFSSDALADTSFESIDAAMRELPKMIQFDCTKQPERERRSVIALDRVLIVPRYFAQSETDENWFDWSVLIESEKDAVVYPYATLSFGEYGSEISLFEEWELVSKPSENHLGAEIRYKQPDESKIYDRHELILFNDGQFLKSMSYVPIDWVSLLSCFE
tara:strand:+ start:774 stop:1283 length:510 start_codon:yes stop_codon:yes gene_type:complete